jgi:23S rRNA (guanine745-N1)-methyltransferase
VTGEPPLACTVRDCGLLLTRRDRVFSCARHHSYDIAHSGYVNLLQPQDRRSPSPGDSRATLAARARLLDRGIGVAILDGFVRHAATIHVPHRPLVLDLGCGDGNLLGRLATLKDVDAIGIDLSTAAIDRASRRFPDLTWVVANADRRLPLLDKSVDLVLSFHARRNPAECARVLANSGSLLLAIPAPEDLVELRALILGEAVYRDRVETVVKEHDGWFTLAERASLRERHHVDGAALRDLLRGTYRGERLSAADRIAAVADVELTLASDVLLLKPRTSRRR